MRSIRIQSISPLAEADFMNIDETDFTSMSRPEQIRHFEVEGYLVLPSVLTPDVIGRLKNELASVEMSHTSYSTQQTRSVQQPHTVPALSRQPSQSGFQSARIDAI